MDLHGALSRLGLHEDLARETGERLAAACGHQDGLADLDAPALHPHAEYRMEHVAAREHCLVALAQADRVLAPIRRIGEADGIADARFLPEPVARNGGAPGGLDIMSERAGLRRREHR